MIDAIGSALSAVIGWFGQVITALVTPAGTSTPAGALYSLLPLLAIGAALGIVFVVFRLIKRVTWGV